MMAFVKLQSTINWKGYAEKLVNENTRPQRGSYSLAN